MRRKYERGGFSGRVFRRQHLVLRRVFSSCTYLILALVAVLFLSDSGHAGNDLGIFPIEGEPVAIEELPCEERRRSEFSASPSRDGATLVKQEVYECICGVDVNVASVYFLTNLCKVLLASGEEFVHCEPGPIISSKTIRHYGRTANRHPSSVQCEDGVGFATLLGIDFTNYSQEFPSLVVSCPSCSSSSSSSAFSVSSEESMFIEESTSSESCDADVRPQLLNYPFNRSILQFVPQVRHVEVLTSIEADYCESPCEHLITDFRLLDSCTDSLAKEIDCDSIPPAGEVFPGTIPATSTEGPNGPGEWADFWRAISESTLPILKGMFGAGE